MDDDDLPAVAIPPQYLADILRHLGYGNFPADESMEQSYYRMGLEDVLYRLTHLTAQTYTFVKSQVDAINQCYAEILGARSNLSTLQVGIITRNPNELAQRRAEYRQLCLDLASWLHIPFKNSNGGGNRIYA